MSFVPVVVEQDVDKLDSLQDVSAFHTFVAGVAERCDVPPVAPGTGLVGGHR